MQARAPAVRAAERLLLAIPSGSSAAADHLARPFQVLLPQQMNRSPHAEVAVGHQCRAHVRRLSDSRSRLDTEVTKAIALAAVVAAGCGAAACIAAVSSSTAHNEALHTCNDAADHSVDDGAAGMTGFEDAFEIRNLLGAGAFGVVMQCRSKETGKEFAVKITQDLETYRHEVAREQLALETIERHGGHDHIVGFERAYSENGFHYLVLECVHGESLFAFMKRRHTLDATAALQLVAQLADALVFMKNLDLIHRDLKPENVMVVNGDDNDDTPQLKIIDFGSAGSESTPDAKRPATLSGTRTYWSPEALEEQHMTAALDAWALGCILYILLSGRHPFDLMGCSTEEQILHRITADQVSFLLSEWLSVPPDVKELVRGLLDKDPSRRLTAQDVLDHPAVVAATKSV